MTSLCRRRQGRPCRKIQGFPVGKDKHLFLVPFLVLMMVIVACQARPGTAVNTHTAENATPQPETPDASAKHNDAPAQPLSLGVEDVVVHTTFSEQVGVVDVLDSMRGQRGVGLVHAEHRQLPRLERPQNREFELAPDKPFTPYLLLSNNTDQPQTHLLSVIVDYQQVLFTLDGKERLLHEVTVPPGKELEIPVSVPIEGEGMHDVLFLEMGDPYNDTLNVDQRMSTVNDTFGTRAIVYVGGEQTPARRLRHLTGGAPIPEGVAYNPPVHFVEKAEQAESHPSERQLYVARAQPGETYHFQVRVANEEDQPVVYAFMPFLNYHQTSVEGQPVLPVQLESNEERLVDVALTLPDEEGIYLYEWVYILDPYQSLLEEEVASPFIKSSERLAIAVRETDDK